MDMDLGAKFREIFSSISCAPVAVEDPFAFHVAAPLCGMWCVNNKTRAHVISDLATHDHLGRQISHDREVEPNLFRAQKCNVTQESSPWDVGSEITVNEFLRILIVLPLNFGALKSPWLKGFQALDAHDFRYQTNTASVPSLIISRAIRLQP